MKTIEQLELEAIERCERLQLKIDNASQDLNLLKSNPTALLERLEKLSFIGPSRPNQSRN